MRLEGDDDAALAGQRAGRLRSPRDLDRVVGVAVVDAHAGDLALALHPPAGAGEAGEAGGQASKACPSWSPTARAATASST